MPAVEATYYDPHGEPDPPLTFWVDEACRVGDLLQDGPRVLRVVRIGTDYRGPVRTLPKVPAGSY